MSASGDRQRGKKVSAMIGVFETGTDGPPGSLAPSNQNRSSHTLRGVEKGESVGQQLLRKRSMSRRKAPVNINAAHVRSKSTVSISEGQRLYESMIIKQNIRRGSVEAHQRAERKESKVEMTFSDDEEDRPSAESRRGKRKQGAHKKTGTTYMAPKQSTSATLVRKISNLELVSEGSSDATPTPRRMQFLTMRTKKIGSIVRPVEIDVASLVGSETYTVDVDSEEKIKQSRDWNRFFSLLHQPAKLRERQQLSVGHSSGGEPPTRLQTQIPTQPPARMKAKEVLKPVLYQSTKKLHTSLQPLRDSDWEELATREEVQRKGRIKYAVRAGFPEYFRRSLWPVLSGAAYERARSRLTYLDLVGHIGEQEGSGVVAQIDKDLPRTVIGENVLDVDGETYQTIRRVLCCFAIFRPSIGYTQSMNFIVALLFRYVPDEEDVFWMLCRLTGSIFPGYWEGAMAAVQVEQAVLHDLLLTRCRPLFDFLDGAGLMQTVLGLTTTWFLCLFINTLPVEACLRIWDCVFMEGSKVLFRCVLALFLVNQRKIMSAQTETDALLIIQDVPKSVVAPAEFLHFAFSIPSFSTREINGLRELHRQEIDEKIRYEEMERKERRGEDIILDDLDSLTDAAGMVDEIAAEKEATQEATEAKKYVHPSWRLELISEPPFDELIIDEYLPS